MTINLCGIIFDYKLINKLIVMNVPSKIESLGSFEVEKLCHLLQCEKAELFEFEKIANEIVEESDSTYDAIMKILQRGHNVRETSLIALLIGRTDGYLQAEADMEDEIKDKLYQAFRGQRGQ